MTSALAIDNAGRLLAVGGRRGDIQVREMPTGRLVATLLGHAPSEIMGLSFTPDGKRLASSARDSVVKLWDLDAHVEVLSLRGQATFDTTVAFSPDGQKLVAGGWDGFLRVWSNADPKSESAKDYRAREKIWHANLGPEQMHNGNLFGARMHLDRWVELDPDSPHARYERGFLFAALGDWNAAGAEMDLALSKPDCSLGCHVDRALLYLRAGDEANYRRICAQGYDRFAKDADWGTANRLGYYVLLGNPPGVTHEQGLAIGEMAFTKAINRFQKSSGGLTFGFALYRAGKIDDALKVLRDSERIRGIPETWYLLAMVHQRKGNTAQAREYFERGAKELEVARSKPKLTDGRNADWRQRAELELLHAEAKKMLDGGN
jgi:tetratricopeptide (TPR) repeat protein